MEGPERRCPKGIEAKFPSCIVFSRPKHYNGRVRPRGVFAASDKSPTRSRKTPFDLGCSRDTSRGCVGRRCTVLSYTFRSHPYQNTVERGCCSKVFFGLRNNDAALREPAIHPEGNAIHGLVEGTISSEMERSVRRVSFAASDNETAFCKKYHRCTKHKKHLVDKYLMRHY